MGRLSVRRLEPHGGFMRLIFSMADLPVEPSPESTAQFIFTRISEELKQIIPWGHPDFIPDVLELIYLHGTKNFDYAQGGDPLGNFDRTAQIMGLYPAFPWATPHGNATVQMLKQLDAYLWMQSAKTEAKVEGHDSRLRDIQVFAGLIRIMLRPRQGGG